MGIKNWTVTAETTRSVSAREIYMNDATHKNHINTEAIVNIFGSANTSANIIANCEKRKMELAKAGKGGRPPTQAMEFVLTLPKGVRPSKEQWQEMITGVVKDMNETMELKPSELNNIVRAVAHQQLNDGKKQGTGDHVHMVVGKFTDSGIFLKKLQQRSVLRTIKLSFNEQVKKTMGLDHAEYTASKIYNGVAKKKAPQWKVKNARQKEALDKLDKALSKRELSQEMIMASYANNISKLANYVEKYNNALLDNSEKQQARQLKRMDGVLAQARELQDAEGFEMTPELINATATLNKQVDKINVDTGERKPLLKVPRK